MQVVRIFILNGTVLDLLILLLEEAHESRAVVTTVALSPNANLVVVGFVVRELGEPRLSKMPQGVSGLGGGVGGVRALLAAKGADLVRKVGLRDAIREVGGGHNPGSILLAVFDGAICWGIVREADLVGFVNVEHVDLVVPAPRVNFSSKILVQDAWAVLLEDSHHGRATRATIQPYSQRRILSADARFEEPEEATSTSVSSFAKSNCSKLVNLRVDVVVLLLALLIIEETAG